MKGNQLSSRVFRTDVLFSDTTQNVYISVTCMIIIKDKNYVVNNNFASVALFIIGQIGSIYKTYQGKISLSNNKRRNNSF